MFAPIYPGRFTAEMPDDFVVFLIGMRVNRPLKVRKWFPVATAMPRMLRWLDEHPEAGLLKWHNAWLHGPAIVQYWRSFDDLARFARAPQEPHLPAWRLFNQAVRGSGEVGIWHETYRIRAGSTSASTATCRGSGSRPSAAIGRSGPPASRRHGGSARARSTSRRSPRIRTRKGRTRQSVRGRNCRPTHDTTDGRRAAPAPLPSPPGRCRRPGPSRPRRAIRA